MKATLRLFKGLPVKERKASFTYRPELSKKTIRMGFVFTEDILREYTRYDELIEIVQDIYGITAEKLNSSFHKSWAKVRDTDIEQLVVEQLAHYLTTYGKESGVLWDM